MRRLNFFGNLLAAGVFRAFAPDSVLASQAPESPIPGTDLKRVLVMFKSHLDVGFTDTQTGVMRKYFDQYFPEAIQVAVAVR